MIENDNPSGSHLYTVATFSEKHPVFSQSSLRHLIYEADDHYSASGDKITGNGLLECGAVLRVGRKVLISEPEFLGWIKSPNRDAA